MRALAAMVLTCAVAGVSSQVAAAAAPAPLAFGPPVSLTPDDANAIGPQVAVNAGGDAVVVWAQFIGSTAVVRASWRAAGGSWSQAVDVTPADGELYVSDVDVALTDRGEAIAVWSGAAGAGLQDTVIQTATRSAQGSWSAPADIARADGTAIGVRVAATPRGEAVTAWSRGSAGVTNVETSSLERGGAWSAPVALNAPGTTAAQFDVGIDARGDAVAVWTIHTGEKVQTATRPAGGVWSAPLDLSAGGAAPWVDLALTRTGAAIAVWNRGSATSGWIVVAAERDRAGQWSPAYDLGAGSLPKVAAGDGGDDAAVVWQRQSSELEAVSRTRAGWSAPVELAAAGGFATLAMSAKGTAVAAWIDGDGLQVSTRTRAGEWSPATLVDAHAAQWVIDSPEVAIGDREDAALAWLRFTPYTVRAVQAAAT